MLDREPEESVPRLLTNTRTSGQTTMVRYGIAMLLESNFANTAIGHAVYLMNIEQIRVATIETCSYGVMIAILEHQPYEDPFDHQYHAMDEGSLSRHQLDDRFAEEIANWGIMHKSAGGYESIRARLASVLSRRCGQEGDFTVIPEGSRSHTHKSSDRNNFQENSVKKGISLGGSAVVQSRPFLQGTGTAPHDPCFRHQTIGGFMTLDDLHLSTTDPKDYRTDFLDVIGYNENKDDWHTFKYRDHYQFSGVWNFREPNANLTDKIGLGFGYDMECYTWGQALRKAGNMERTVDKLLLLGPEKQQECLASLRLLPENDQRSGPSVERFNRALFDGMDAHDMEFDETYSVAERRALERGGQKRSARHAEFEAYQDRHHKRADARTLEEQFDEGSDVEMEEEKFESTPGRTIVDGHLIAKYAAHRPTVRSTAPAVKPAGIAQQAKKLEEDIVALGKTLNNEVNGKALLAPEEKSNEDIGKGLSTWIKTLDGLCKGQEEPLVGLLVEAKRVMSKITDDAHRVRRDFATKGLVAPVVVTLQDLTAMLTANFTPFLTAQQTLLLAKTNTEDQTPLERAIGRTGEAPPEACLPGWWNPSALAGSNQPPEDGQVFLSVFGTSNREDRIPLPHDSFASTLCADHLVLFALPTDVVNSMTNFEDETSKLGTFALDIQPGLKRDRVDRLAWSIAMSVIYCNSIMASGVNRNVQHEAVMDWIRMVSEHNPAMFARLQRVSLSPPKGVLPSQEVLKGTIDWCRFTLEVAVKASGVWNKFRDTEEAEEAAEETKDVTVAEFNKADAEFNRLTTELGDLNADFNNTKTAAAAKPPTATAADVASAKAALIAKQKELTAATDRARECKDAADAADRAHTAATAEVGTATSARDAHMSYREIIKSSALASAPVFNLPWYASEKLLEEFVKVRRAGFTTPAPVAPANPLLARIAAHVNANVKSPTGQAAVLQMSAVVFESRLDREVAFEAWKRQEAAVKAAAARKTPEDYMKDNRALWKDMYELLEDHHASAKKPVTNPASYANGAQAPHNWSKTGITSLLDRASIVSGLFYKFSVDNHVPLAFYLRLWRASKTYNMGTMIRMVSGKDGAAVTYYKNPDFMLAENGTLTHQTQALSEHCFLFWHLCSLSRAVSSVVSLSLFVELRKHLKK